MEIHRSARRHGVAVEDIAHAYVNTLRWAMLSEDPDRYLVAGPDRSGKLVELVLLSVDTSVLVIHAMRLRTSTERRLFGGRQR